MKPEKLAGLPETPVERDARLARNRRDAQDREDRRWLEATAMHSRFTFTEIADLFTMLERDREATTRTLTVIQDTSVRFAAAFEILRAVRGAP